MKQAYKNLTGVDVERQKALRNERAKGYIGEVEVLSELLQYVEGKFKVLMNLNVPIDGKKTEIDLLMIHETGIYVFEVNNYKGIIYGDLDGKRWPPISGGKARASLRATGTPSTIVFSYRLFECSVSTTIN